MNQPRWLKVVRLGHNFALWSQQKSQQYRKLAARAQGSQLPDGTYSVVDMSCDRRRRNLVKAALSASREGHHGRCHRPRSMWSGGGQAEGTETLWVQAYDGQECA